MHASQGRSIAHNTTLLTGAYIFQKICAFLYFTFLARVVGAEGIGAYTFAISFATIFAICIDYGLNAVLIREAAKYPEKSERYLHIVTTIKVVFSLVVYAVMVSAVVLLHHDPLITFMTALAGVALVLDTIALSFWGVFRARQNLWHEARAIIINQVIAVAIGTTSVLLGFPLYWLIIALVSGSIFSFTYAAIFVRRELGYHLRFVWDNREMRALVLLATPFALGSIFSRVYASIDQVMLGLMAGSQVLGWYSVANKLTFAFQFIPAALAASLYPAMSASFTHARERLARQFEQSMEILCMVSVPIATGIFVIAHDLIRAVYTEQYAPTVSAVRILIFALVFLCLSYPLGALLNASDRQDVATAHMGATMILNILLNIVLIPTYGHLGAAYASLIAWGILVLLHWSQVGASVRYNRKYLFSKYARIVGAGMIMGGTVWGIQSAVPLMVTIAIGALVYPAALYALRAITKGEMSQLFQSMRGTYEKNTTHNS